MKGHGTEEVKVVRKSGQFETSEGNIVHLFKGNGRDGRGWEGRSGDDGGLVDAGPESIRHPGRPHFLVEHVPEQVLLISVRF